MPPPFATTHPNYSGSSSSSSSSSSNNNQNSKMSGKLWDSGGPQRGKSVTVGGASNFFMQQELLAAPPTLDGRSRLKKAQKIEASIAQMGQLFTQMASLVMEQSETIARIEDDVEEGLVDTKAAHESMTSLNEVTKGNRAMIFKVFAILIFFIFLFLVWT